MDLFREEGMIGATSVICLGLNITKPDMKGRSKRGSSRERQRIEELRLKDGYC